MRSVAPHRHTQITKTTERCMSALVMCTTNNKGFSSLPLDAHDRLTRRVHCKCAKPLLRPDCSDAGWSAVRCVSISSLPCRTMALQPFPHSPRSDALDGDECCAQRVHLVTAMQNGGSAALPAQPTPLCPTQHLLDGVHRVADGLVHL